MQNHVKNYLRYYNLTTADKIYCEVCNSNQSIDLHHIIPRSKFGSKTKDIQDNIENLIALCRDCHNKAHNGQFTKSYLTDLHLGNL